MSWIALAAGLAGAAAAQSPTQEPPSIVHPIYAQMPEAPQNDVALRELTHAADRYKLRPVEVVDIELPEPPKTAAALKVGIQLVKKLAFADALKQLDAVAGEIAATGGVGLGTTDLGDLYLYRGMAIAKADWKPERSVDAATSARAFEDYVRAATLVPDRVLNPRETPLQVLDDWQKAVAEVQQRPRGTLIVRGNARARITLDGRIPASGPDGATFKDLPYGEHLVHVEEIGRVPWGTGALVNTPTSDVVIPARAALTLDDATAAAHARRMGAKFALVGELKLGEREPALQLRLVDITGIRHDATEVPLLGERGTLDAGIMRLDEEARRIEQLGLAPAGDGAAGAPAAEAPAAPTPALPPVVLTPLPPPRPSLRSDPRGWAHDHWPLLTAAGALIGASLVLGLTVGFEGSR